jgi:ribokinase
MENAARELLGRGPSTIVLTIGDRGALLVDAEGAYHIPAVFQ